MKDEVKPTSPAEERYADAVPGGTLHHRQVKVKVKEKLTEAQLSERGEKLSDLLGEIEKAEDELKSIKSRYKAKVENLELEITALRGEIDSREGMVEITANEYFLPKIQKAVVRRPDTNEILSERPMTMSELQQDIFAGESDPPPPASEVEVPNADEGTEDEDLDGDEESDEESDEDESDDEG